MKFLFNENLEKIEELHKTFKCNPAKTLREEFALGHGYRWSAEKNIELYNSPVFHDIVDYMASGKSGDFKQFGVYPRSEIWRLWKISETIPMIDVLLPGVLDKKCEWTLDYEDLESVSEVCQTRTGVLLAIKSFVIGHSFDEHFKGYHPQTSPVVAAEEMLFKYPLTRKEHKELCEKWAVDFGTTPTGINTFLWHLGMDLKES